MDDTLTKDPIWYGCRIDGARPNEFTAQITNKISRYCKANNIDPFDLSPAQVIDALRPVVPVEYVTESFGDWIELDIDALKFTARQLTYVHAEAPTESETSAA